MERKKEEHKTYAEHRKGMMHEMRPKHEGMKAEKKPEMRAHKKEGEAIKRVEKAHKMEGEKMGSGRKVVDKDSPAEKPVAGRDAMAKKVEQRHTMNGPTKTSEGMAPRMEGSMAGEKMGRRTVVIHHHHHYGAKG
jgi:hypothetical protein